MSRSRRARRSDRGSDAVGDEVAWPAGALQPGASSTRRASSRGDERKEVAIDAARPPSLRFQSTSKFLETMKTEKKGQRKVKMSYVRHFRRCVPFSRPGVLRAALLRSLTLSQKHSPYVSHCVLVVTCSFACFVGVGRPSTGRCHRPSVVQRGVIVSFRRRYSSRRVARQVEHEGTSYAHTHFSLSSP